MAGPTTQFFPVSASSRCLDFLTRFGGGRGTTSGLIATPHLGQRAVPGDTSTRQREQAGKSSTLLPAVMDASAQATSPTGSDLSTSNSEGKGGHGPRVTRSVLSRLALRVAALELREVPKDSEEPMSVRSDFQSLPWGCSGAMRIGRRVCDASVWETLPSRVLRRTPRPRWPHTISRAERWSATSNIALGIPSKDSLTIGEGFEPCSLARSAPSSALIATRDPSDPSKQNSTGPVWL